MSTLVDRARGLFRRKGGETPGPVVHAGLETALDGRTAIELTEALISGDGDTETSAATAIGRALAGVRTAVRLDGEAARSALPEAARRHVPIVAHVVGHGAVHALADAGLVTFVAQDAQDAVDLTLAAHRIAETALTPVIVAVDVEVMETVQELRMTDASAVGDYLGAADDEVPSPTPAQEMLFGPKRRRVPRWHDLDRPMLVGARRDDAVDAVARAGHARFFAEALPAQVDEALSALAAITGRPHSRLSLAGPARADALVVTTGAAVARAEAVSGASTPFAVAGIRCLWPLPGAALAEAMAGRKTVVAVEAAEGAEPPLLRALRAIAGRALENGRFGGETHPGWPAWKPRDQPQLRALSHAFGPLGCGVLAAVVAGADGEIRNPTSAYPKRQALLDNIAHHYPPAPEPTGGALDVRPKGARTVRIADATEAAALLYRVLGGSVRGAGELATWSPDPMRDAGDAPPVDLSIPAGPREQMLGAMIKSLDVDAPPRRVFAAREAMLGDAPDAAARLAAFEEGYEAGHPTVAPTKPTEPTLPAVPFALRHLHGSGTRYDSLPRFWDHVGVLYRDGAVGELCPDPYLAAGPIPPLSSMLRDLSVGRQTLPSLDAARCTGCGRCWTSCPEGAIGPVATTPNALLEAAMAEISDVDVGPLRRIQSKLARAAASSIKAPTEARALFDEAFAAQPADRREAAGAAFAAVRNALGDLPMVPAAGALISLVVDPDTCKACRICVAECETTALDPTPQTAAGLATARERWHRWERMPDTTGDLIDKAADDPTLGPMAARLLSRHCLLAVGGGDGAEPGSGARLALRQVLASAEFHLQRRLAELRRDVDAMAERLEERAKKAYASGLVVDGATAPPRDEDETVRTLLDARGDLVDLSARLARGDAGLGRARAGVLIASAEVAKWSATFPDNPFQTPAVVVDREVAATTRGLLDGQLDQAADGARCLRAGKLALDRPAEVPFQREALKKLAWRDLDPNERRALPPMFLISDDALDADALSLLRSDLPIKIVALCDPSRGLTGLAALAQRDAFVLQTSFAAPTHLTDGVIAALKFDGPALIAVHAPSPTRNGFSTERLIDEARAAVADRTWPLFRYDPTVDGVFGQRLDLSGNPDVAETWSAGAKPADSAVADNVELVWRTLQELAGISTPFTASVEAAADARAAVSIEAAERAPAARLEDVKREVRAELTTQVQARLLALSERGRAVRERAP